MMQHQLSKNNIKEIKLLIKQLNSYFPNDILPIDPWLGFEIMDKIYKPLGDLNNQKLLLMHLINSNSDVNVKLICVIRALELGHYDLVKTLINDYILKENINIESKLALLFESINSIGYHIAIDPLINDILNNHDINKLSINDKYAIFGILYQIKHIEGTIKLGKSLLLHHHKDELKDVNSQKYISDILLEFMGSNIFIDFCITTFEKDKIDGMLYSLINAYKINRNYEKALQTIDHWLKENPGNKRMINKRNNILESMQIQ